MVSCWVLVCAAWQVQQVLSNDSQLEIGGWLLVCVHGARIRQKLDCVWLVVLPLLPARHCDHTLPMVFGFKRPRVPSRSAPRIVGERNRFWVFTKKLFKHPCRFELLDRLSLAHRLSKRGTSCVRVPSSTSCRRCTVRSGSCNAR